jgi:3-phosphoshikimate 1-carboxyvinyltransferase
MGINIELLDDLMSIHGGDLLQGAAVHSHHDHRIAMACAVAGLRANGPTSITEAEAIDKSYPAFYDHLQQLGAQLKSNI